MANQRAAHKELVTAWVHKNLKRDTKSIVQAEGCASVSDLVIKLLEERVALHQRGKMQPVSDLIAKLLKGYASRYRTAEKTS